MLSLLAGLVMVAGFIGFLVCWCAALVIWCGVFAKSADPAVVQRCFLKALVTGVACWVVGFVGLFGFKLFGSG